MNNIVAKIRVNPDGIKIDDAYEIKNKLKIAGYEYNNSDKSWEKGLSSIGDIRNDHDAMNGLASLVKEAIALGASYLDSQLKYEQSLKDEIMRRMK